MEEPQSRPSEGYDRSAKTAEMLRNLHAQAVEKLDVHRQRVSDIETQITERLQQISEVIARDRVAEELEAAASEELQSRVERLQESLGESSNELSELREQLVDQAVDHEAELGKRDEELGQLIEQLEHAEAERGRLSQQIKEQQAESERIAQELQSAYQALEELRNQQGLEGDQLRSELASLQREKEELHHHVGQLQEELASARQASEAAQHETEQLRQQECESSDATRQQLEQLQQTLHENEKGFAEQLEEKQRELQSQQEGIQTQQESIQALEQTLSETQENLDQAQAKNKEATFALQAAELRILELSNGNEHEHQLEQVNRKFELALADVHKLKRENAELHSELASRPEATDGESPELVSLRSERDALATRIAELESAPAQETDAEVQQELSDLQRRFELAVDDVRDLKQENAKLKEQLEAGDSAGGTPALSDASDWQAQKARLLAELNAEDSSSPTPERREQRATIEGTISITDQVVAEKDKEIAELKATMSSGPSQDQLEQLKQSLREEIFANDDQILEERERLQHAQEEWQEKLRKAELELSVERAKLAREHSALEEKLATLQEATLDTVEDEGKPRRRWLSALGLKEDDDGE